MLVQSGKSVLLIQRKVKFYIYAVFKLSVFIIYWRAKGELSLNMQCCFLVMEI